MRYIGISVWWLPLAFIFKKSIGNNAPNAFEYNHHVYTIHYGNYEWSRANMMCRLEFGELIPIENSLLQQKISQVLKHQEIEPDGFWIGIFDGSAYALSSSWLSTEISDIGVNYTNWYTPDLQPEMGDCAMMRADNFKWEKYLCFSVQYQFSFICKNNLFYPYINALTIEDNVADVIPGLYFEVNVQLMFPFGFSSRYCLIMMRDFSLEDQPIIVDTSSFTIDIGKNIINHKIFDGTLGDLGEYFQKRDCFIIENVQNRTGNADDNLVNFSYGFFFRRKCDYNRIIILPFIHKDDARDFDYSHFPLVFKCSNSNIIMNNTKTAYLEISYPRSDLVSLKKGKILTITIDAYIPYFYPHVSAEISGANGNNTDFRPLWLKLDQVGWNYDIPGNGLENMEVETCIVKNSLIVNLPEVMANRGVYLATNTTEKDLVRFRAYVYLADHARDNISYPVTVRVYTNKSTELETLENIIHILATNISEDEYIEMVDDLPLVSFLEEENVNGTTKTMTIMADTVQDWTLSYYILLFMDTDNLTSDVQFGNVTVTKVGANLNCESVNMLFLDTSDIADDTQRRDLAVIQINVSNVYNVSANESAITLRMMVTADTTITYINVTFITPEVFTTLTSNDTSSINVSDDSCDNRSDTVKQDTFILLVFVLVVSLVT